jgi:hypothetical protein
MLTPKAGRKTQATADTTAQATNASQYPESMRNGRIATFEIGASWAWVRRQISQAIRNEIVLSSGSASSP